MNLSVNLPDEAATKSFGSLLGKAIDQDGGVIFLQGELGAGKTTMVRAILHALGYVGRVVSPSYTLMEPYNVGARQVFHLDLYRLTDPEELEYLGIRDLNPRQHLLLVEWPEHGSGMLPPADLQLIFKDAVEAVSRLLECQSLSDSGARWVRGIDADMPPDYKSVG